MPVKLVVSTNRKGDVFELPLLNERYRIGRNRDNDLRIKEPYISTYHAEIRRTDDDVYELRDLNSSNGTFLNGVKIEKTETIESGDYIKFGILKVAVRDEVGDTPKILSLRDRPSFQRKAEDTAAIKVDANTGKIASLDTLEGPDDVSDTAPAKTAPTARKSGEKDLEAKYKKAKAELASREEQLDKLLSEIESAEKAVQTAEKRADTVDEERREEVTKLEERLKKADAESRDEKKKLDEAERSLESAKQQASDLESKLEKLASAKSDIKRLESEKTEGEKALREAQEEIATLKEVQTSSARKSGELQSTLEQTRVELKQLQADLDKEKTAVEDRETEVAKLKDSLSSAEAAQKLSLESAAKEESVEIERLKQELEEKESAFSALEKELADEAEQKKELEARVSAVESSLSDRDAEIAAFAIQRDGWTRTENSLAHKLKKAESDNEALSEKVKAEANASHAGSALVRKLEAELQESRDAHDRDQTTADSEHRKDIQKLEKEIASARKQISTLTKEKETETEEKQAAKQTIRSLEGRIVELESEASSNLERIRVDEANRSKLDSELSDKLALVSSQALSLKTLEEELSSEKEAAVKREAEHRESEKTLKATLTEAIEEQRDRADTLEHQLDETRRGFSAALRNAWTQTREQRALAKARTTGQIASVEEELAVSLSSREKLEHERSILEDQLNDRDEAIESLTERIENLTQEASDREEELQARTADLRHTQAGFSSILRGQWGQLEKNTKFLSEREESIEKLRQKLSVSEESLATIKSENERLARDHAQELKAEQKLFSEYKKKIKQERADQRQNAISESESAIVELGARQKELERGKLKLVKQVDALSAEAKELEESRKQLQEEKQELDSGLKIARTELDTTQKRCLDSRDEEATLVQTISSMEKRIASLKGLETELQHALERQEQSARMSRSTVFQEDKDSVKSKSKKVSDDSDDEIAFCKELISKIDELDDISSTFRRKLFSSRVSDQLEMLKRSFLELLENHSVTPFQIDPGTVLSVEERRRIKLVFDQSPVDPSTSGSSGNGKQAAVAETLRPGYIYHRGKDDLIIRKAEVTVA